MLLSPQLLLYQLLICAGDSWWCQQLSEKEKARLVFARDSARCSSGQS